MVLQACFWADTPLAQVSFDALQVSFASDTALLHEVTFAAWVAFIAMTEAEQAAPQAVAGPPGWALVKAAEAADPSQSETFAAPEFAKKLKKTGEIANYLSKISKSSVISNFLPIPKKILWFDCVVLNILV